MTSNSSRKDYDSLSSNISCQQPSNGNNDSVVHVAVAETSKIKKEEQKDN